MKNCRSNPYCIRRLGLDKFEKLKTQHSENSTSDLIRRDVDKEPCGLVNFGNFCYVNSFLQVVLIIQGLMYVKLSEYSIFYNC